MDHGPNQQQTEDPRNIARNQSIGWFLFFLYALAYFGFIVVCVLMPDILDQRLILDLPNSVSFGFGLILLAMVLALVYGVACRDASSHDSAAGKGGRS